MDWRCIGRPTCKPFDHLQVRQSMHQSKLKSAGVPQMHAPIQRSISPSRSLTCISPVPPGHSTSSNVDPASFSASCSRGDKKCSLCQPTLSFCDMVRYGAMLKKRDIAKWRWRRGWCYVNVGGCYIGSRMNRKAHESRKPRNATCRNPWDSQTRVSSQGFARGACCLLFYKCDSVPKQVLPDY